MSVKPDTAFRMAYAGHTYLFCCDGCLERFRVTPERYLDPAAPAIKPPPRSASNPGPPSGRYTCPMHPEIESPRPGDCPKCGMALESLAPVGSERGTGYVCPMHPEIVEDRPGSCPICGMALEPRAPVAEEDNPELRDMTRRFWIGAALAVPLVVASMTGMGSLQWLELILTTPIVLWCGWPFLRRGYDSLVHRHLNMFTLIAPMWP